jgi:hypothetical protein
LFPPSSPLNTDGIKVLHGGGEKPVKKEKDDLQVFNKT